jgi:hypothetical protein
MSPTILPRRYAPAASVQSSYLTWPRRALRSHDYQCAPRKLSAPPTILSRRYVPAASVQLYYLTHSGFQLLSQGRPGVPLARHQRRRQALRRQHSVIEVGKHCDGNAAQPDASAAAKKHCEYNDAQPDRFSHGRRDRDVRYARTIVNAHYVS